MGNRKHGSKEWKEKLDGNVFYMNYLHKLQTLIVLANKLPTENNVENVKKKYFLPWPQIKQHKLLKKDKKFTCTQLLSSLTTILLSQKEHSSIILE